MGNRIFVAMVMLLWVSTMSWLMVARILPPFFQGEPPAHGILYTQDPLCWQIQYGERPVGYAVSQAVPGLAGTTEIYSRVLLDKIAHRAHKFGYRRLIVHCVAICYTSPLPPTESVSNPTSRSRTFNTYL